jgi:signal transduction histidine kinase
MNVVTIFITSTILFLLLAILVVTFVLFYQKKMLGQRYHLQELEHTREMDLMQATIDAQEREQNRIGKDLHDDLGALLTASRIQIQQIKRFIDKKDEVNTFIDLGSEMLDLSIDRLGAIAKSLSPPTLEHFGIKDALEEYAAQFSSTGTIEINTSIIEKRYEAATELAIFRMTQELVNNTVKYANASKVDISLTANNEWIWLNYSDDGDGFDLNTVKKGLGLRNLEGRSNKLGGGFKVNSESKSGFHAEIHLPVRQSIIEENGK